MSARNTLVAKRDRRMRRSLRATPPAYIDLVQWVKLRTRVSSGMARKVIFAGALKVDSHTVGVKTIGKGDKQRKVIEQCVPVDAVGTDGSKITVVPLPKASA